MTGATPRCAGRPRRVRLPELVTGGAADRLPPVWALTRYTDPVRSAILAGKERGRRDLPALLGTALGNGLLRLHRLGLLREPDLAGARAEQASGGPGPGRRPGHRDGRRRGPVRRRARPPGRGRARAWSPPARPGTRWVWTPPRRAANLADRVRWLRRAAPPAGASGRPHRRRADHRRDHRRRVPGAALGGRRRLRGAGVASVPGWIGTR